MVDWNQAAIHCGGHEGGTDMNDAMNDQSRPEQPEDGHGAEGGAARAADSPDTAAQGAAKKTTTKQDVHAPELHGKPRQGYLDPSGSEATREMRDQARRRRDAEEKLQQHLIEAKEHIPNEHHGHH
jgi:hypothetical protein